MCEIFLAVHVDMLGSASGRVNESKREVLADFVLQLLDHLKGGSANYFTGNDSHAGVPGAATFDYSIDQENDHTHSRQGPGTIGSTSTNNAQNIDRSTSKPSTLLKTKEDEERETNSRALGLDREQVREILSRANDAISHMKQCYSSKLSQTKSSIKGPSVDNQLRAGEASPTPAVAAAAATESDYLYPGKATIGMDNSHDITVQDQASVVGGVGTWETFYDSEGITVSEQSGSNRPVGTLSASCTLEASPQTIRSLLLEHQDQIDGMLAGKSVLNKIDARTYVQWLAYKSIWPLGARDFLLVTAETPFPAEKDEGFLIVSTSIDDICEEIDDGDTDVDEPGASARGSAAATASREQRIRKLAEFSRSKIRLAGYIGVPSTTVRGGTDLSLFVDIDVYSYTPAWLVQVLAQYGLSEMMGRIRHATMGQSANSQSSQLDVILGRIQSWESRLKLFRDEDQQTQVGPLSSPSRSHNNKAMNILAGGIGVSSGTGFGKRSVSSSNSLATLASEKVHQINDDSTAASTASTSENGDHEHKEKHGGEDEKSATELVSPTPKPVRSPGQQLADHARELIEKYLGIRSANDLGLDWIRKVSKGAVTVDTSLVTGSTWQAIRGKMSIQANPEKIRDLLINDDRIGEFDDMFDFYKVRAYALTVS